MSVAAGSTRVTCACCLADDPGHEGWCPFPEVDAVPDDDLERAAVAAVIEMAAVRNATRSWVVAFHRAEEIGRRLRKRSSDG